jgi:hypothetical protein
MMADPIPGEVDGPKKRISRVIFSGPSIIYPTGKAVPAL